jgi:hypothetical protein
VFDRAMAIISGGEDIAALERLDASPSAIAKRRKETAKLLERLRSPRAARRRKPLTTPEPLLFAPGEAIAWPTDKGQHIASWVPGKFKQDGWGFGIVGDAGHLYGVLAYHAVQALKLRRAERPAAGLAEHCPRSEHLYGKITPEAVTNLRVESLGPVAQAALGPPFDPEMAQRDARKAALVDGGLPPAFSLDAFNNAVWPGPKFMFMAPSGTPLDPNEPDQRPGMYEDDAEFPALPPDQPATRARYFTMLRDQAKAGS